MLGSLAQDNEARCEADIGQAVLALFIKSNCDLFCPIPDFELKMGIPEVQGRCSKVSIESFRAQSHSLRFEIEVDLFHRSQILGLAHT